jgi:hypothetical protein
MDEPWYLDVLRRGRAEVSSPVKRRVPPLTRHVLSRI